jgi:hypothetical protein
MPPGAVHTNTSVDIATPLNLEEYYTDIRQMASRFEVNMPRDRPVSSLCGRAQTDRSRP